MKKQILKLSTAAIALTLTFAACNKNDNPPVPVEGELITTLKLSVTNAAGFSETFIYKIENGFGNITQGNVQIDTIKLSPNTTYNVTATILNEKEAPAEDVTTEVIEEKDEHLFLYNSNPVSGAGSISTSAGSLDNNGMPFNQTISFTTGAAGSGSLTVNLMHVPTDKSGTTPAASGGETDVEAVYPVKLQ